jgi:transposase InsO family protein
MQLWQLDIVDGDHLVHGRDAKVITGVDDHSRFCVIAAVVPRATGRAVCLALVEAFGRYGIPDELLTDIQWQTIHGQVQPGWWRDDVRPHLPGERRHASPDPAADTDDHREDRTVSVRHVAPGCIPGSAGRNSKGGSWV